MFSLSSEKSDLFSGSTHTLYSLQDERPDVVLLVEGEQLQLKDSRMVRSYTSSVPAMVLRDVRTVWYLLCEVVQFVVQVRCDAVVFGYQGNGGTHLLAGQPEAVG